MGRAKTVLGAIASAVGYVPFRFGLASVLGCSYRLRCVVFHDISTVESDFTSGMGITTPPSHFEAALTFLAKRYHPVSLQDVLSHPDGRGLPPRAALVTFDDGYASVAHSAVPVCKELGVPATLFLNASVIDNHQLSADNLVCYVANTQGMDPINVAARAVLGWGATTMAHVMEVFHRLLPSLRLKERIDFLNALGEVAGVDQRQLAAEAGLYLSSNQVRDLCASGFDIGNHTRSHIHCRCLSADEFYDEIDNNKAELEAMSGKAIRSFSVPYGSVLDVPRSLLDHLKSSGHDLIFLSQAAANCRQDNNMFLDRVGLRGRNGDTLFLELELVPRLRRIRNRISGRN